jgi:hypothetical protein
MTPMFSSGLLSRHLSPNSSNLNQTKPVTSSLVLLLRSSGKFPSLCSPFSSYPSPCHSPYPPEGLSHHCSTLPHLFVFFSIQNPYLTSFAFREIGYHSLPKSVNSAGASGYSVSKERSEQLALTKRVQKIEKRDFERAKKSHVRRRQTTGEGGAGSKKRGLGLAALHCSLITACRLSCSSSA